MYGLQNIFNQKTNKFKFFIRNIEEYDFNFISHVKQNLLNKVFFYFYNVTLKHKTTSKETI